MQNSALAEKKTAEIITPDFSVKTIDSLDVQDIMKLIPHRYPFLLVDRMEDLHLGQSAVGIKNVSMNEWFFQGHFPTHPIMPGVLIIEAMAQTAGALVVKTLQVQNGKDTEQTDGSDIMVYFMSVEEAKFRKPVVPGDVLRLQVTKDRARGNIWRFKGLAFVGDTLVSEASFMAMIVDKK
ncbi:MAG: 3-hydroxyacyl-ACP dehydratase FabZ [Pseudomonadota bacterium]